MLESFCRSAALLRIEFALIVVYIDYEGEPGAIHRQTRFGNGVRIPFVCIVLIKKIRRTIGPEKREDDRFLIEICRLRWLNVAKMLFWKVLLYNESSVFQSKLA